MLINKKFLTLQKKLLYKDYNFIYILNINIINFYYLYIILNYKKIII